MNTTLEFRPGEKQRWYTWLPEETMGPPEGERIYAVALVKTPLFPGPSHPECNSLALVVAEIYPTKTSDGKELWGWIHPSAEAKEHIGRTLFEKFGGGLELGRWYYMVNVPR